MGKWAANATRIGLMLLAAGAGYALCGEQGGAAGAVAGSSMRQIVGEVLKGVPSNFIAELGSRFASWRFNRPRDPTEPPVNHDLDLLAARAISQTLSICQWHGRDTEAVADFCSKIKKATLGQIQEVLKSPALPGLDDTAMLAVIGTPVGGQATPAQTPEFWTAFTAKLAHEVSANPNNANAVGFVAGWLHRNFAAQANDILRDTFGPQGRPYIAAQMLFLQKILTAANESRAEFAAHRAEFAHWQSAVSARFDQLVTILSTGQPTADLATTTLIQETRTLVGSFAAKLDAIEADTAEIRARHAPKLTLPTIIVSDQRDRFVYRTERLKVVGREGELEALNAWLDKRDDFGWDLWVGPAGSGKSRLALALCRLRGDWHCGFFHWTVDNTPDWTLWQPTRSTLIIFDYVAEHAEVIGSAIATLARRGTPGAEHPLPTGIRVRCLLLERAALRTIDPDTSAAPAASPGALAPARLEAPWLGLLRTAATATGAPAEAAFARGDIQHPGRYIGGVPDEAVWAIIADEASLAEDRTTLEGLRERFAAVRRIDPHGRPLFVAMAAEGHREHAGLVSFDQLVAHINGKEWAHACQRLQKHPSGPGATMERWAALVCLATMCQGLTGAALAGALKNSPELDLPPAGEWGNGSRYELLVSGARPLHAPQLEPDILGEAFVLSWLRENRMVADTLIARAWELGMADFVSRAAQNFPEATSASGLLRPGGHARAEALAAAHTALAFVDWQHGNPAAVAARGRFLAEDRAQPALVRALGLFMWMQDRADAATLDAFAASVKNFDIPGLADAGVRKGLASGLNNAIGHAGAETARSDGLLDELRRLARDHPADAGVREGLASGLFNAIVHAGAETARSDGLLDELRTLARDHPADAALHAIVFHGCYAAFWGRLQSNQLTIPPLAYAVELVPGLPRDQPTAELVTGLTNLVTRVAGQVEGEAKPVIEQFGAALRAAYRDHFGAA